MNTLIKSKRIAIHFGRASKYDREFDSYTHIDVVISEIIQGQLPLCLLSLEIDDGTGEFSCRLNQRFESLAYAKRKANQLGKMFGLPKIDYWEEFTQ